MRILHTADWHLGKTLEGRDRTLEQAQFLDELCRICDEEAVDLVVVSGDIYQHFNPSAVAEELFYDAVDRLCAHGKRGLVVIAGNHDSPERLCAASSLAERLGITLVGLPNEVIPESRLDAPHRVRRISAGRSWVELAIPQCNQTAIIAALPYPSEARLREVLSESGQETDLLQGYNTRLAALFAELGTHFRKDAVNLVASHVYVAGGIESESEVQIQMGGAYAVDAGIFPASAQYVALGHLHRAQTLRHAQIPIRYAGSPLAYSFSEAGQTKSVTIVDVLAGGTAAIKELPLTSGKPLVRWTARLGVDEVRQWMEEGRDRDAWIDLELYVQHALSLEQIQALRGMYRGLINIRPVFQVSQEAIPVERMSHLSLSELFARFYKEQTGGGTPDEGLVRLFLELASDVAVSDEKLGNGACE